MQEIWKDVKGYEGYYMISSYGLIKSLERFVKYKQNHSGLRKEKILKSNITKLGYVHATICMDKVNKTIKIHRLVALAFIDNPNNYPCVNHINGIKSDNRVENLEWCTYSENTKHAFNIGLKQGKKGKLSHFSKLNIETVNDIRIEYKSKNISQLKLSLKYNISQSQINRIVNNLNWV